MAIAIVSLEEQERLILEKSYECAYLIQQESQNTGPACPRVWDGVLCWPPTPNGTVASLNCPDYVSGFVVTENATRRCTTAGDWWIHPSYNNTWTNLTSCSPAKKMVENYEIPELIAAHMGSLRLMKNIGYGISLISLTIAVFLMLYFKIPLTIPYQKQAQSADKIKYRRLHCPRNLIHIHLFVSFILRATISFVIENALVRGVGFPSDVKITGDNTVEFLDNGPHVGCKILFTIFNYILGANYMWIFAEGVYLHMLISVAMFSEKSGVKKLIIFGWAGVVPCGGPKKSPRTSSIVQVIFSFWSFEIRAPVLFVGPWVVVRATLENVLCWNTHPTAGYFWMIRGPICAAMVINFFIFLNIIRVLFTKLNAFKTPDAKTFRLRKLAKSTLVLIPLFGVHYIVFIGLPAKVDQNIELVKLYYEMFFNSFQGFLVSLLFCFFNGEVQGELKKKWNRYMLKREGSSFHRRHTMTSFIDKPTANNHNGVEVESPTRNGHCIKDRCKEPDKNKMKVIDIENVSDDHELLGDDYQGEIKHEMYPMTVLTRHSEEKEDCGVSDPMLNNKHKDNYDDNT